MAVPGAALQVGRTGSEKRLKLPVCHRDEGDWLVHLGGREGGMTCLENRDCKIHLHPLLVRFCGPLQLDEISKLVYQEKTGGEGLVFRQFCVS
jgi:hypothetical protein